MNYLQVTIKNENQAYPRFLKLLLVLNFIAVIITFLLNFLGSPILKYHYLIHILITFAAVTLYEFPKIFPIIVSLYFIEGQGRIIWEYASWSRIIFDSLVFISVLKIFIIHKKIFNIKKTPAFLAILIAGHFCWYLIEFTNPNSVSYFAVLAASKLYIYPLLLFFGLSQVDFDFNDDHFQKNLNFFILLFALELVLAIYQFYMKENLLLQISSYYLMPMKNIVFTGVHYRPFNTTHLPGAISVFIYLTAGLIFLRKPSTKALLTRILLFATSGWVLILCQVRSAFIKFILIIFAIHLGELIYLRFKSRSILGIILALLLLIFIPNNILKLQSNGEDAGVEYAKDRISSLRDIDKIKSSRLNFKNFFEFANNSLQQYPLGVGPGFTGAAASITSEKFEKNPLVRTSVLWTGDNLIISLLVDFGIGAIFYLLILLYIPLYFLRFLVIFYKNKIHDHYKILLVSFSTVLVTLIGNWGAVGLTYNPESFAFWFFSALGFSTIAKYKLNISNTKSKSA